MMSNQYIDIYMYKMIMTLVFETIKSGRTQNRHAPNRKVSLESYVDKGLCGGIIQIF